MRCTIRCDCGRSITVDRNDLPAECPDCDASYAVTLTQLQGGEESIESR